MGVIKTKLLLYMMLGIVYSAFSEEIEPCKSSGYFSFQYSQVTIAMRAKGYIAFESASGDMHYYEASLLKGDGDAVLPSTLLDFIELSCGGDASMTYGSAGTYLIELNGGSGLSKIFMTDSLKEEMNGSSFLFYVTGDCYSSKPIEERPSKVSSINDANFNIGSNIARDILCVKSSEQSMYSIYNSDGSLIATGILYEGTNEVDVSLFAAGIYFIAVDNGGSQSYFLVEEG